MAVLCIPVLITYCWMSLTEQFIQSRVGVNPHDTSERLSQNQLAIITSCESKIANKTCSIESCCKDLSLEKHMLDSQSLKDCASHQPTYDFGIVDCMYERQGTPSPNVELLYIELTKKTVLGSIYSQWDGFSDGHIWPPDSSKACSMIGLRRMNNLHFLIEEVIRLNIPGDFIETGIWRGGASIFVTSMFLAYGQICPSPTCRRVFVADSFKGIPAVDLAKYPEDSAHQGAHEIQILHDNSKELVQATFQSFGVLSNSVIWLKGWFKDTLPASKELFTTFSVIRLDGDTYESTWQPLVYLYKRLSIGGFVIVDDYTDWVGCRKAVNDFRTKFKITSEIRPAFHLVSEEVRGVWWQKREEIHDMLSGDLDGDM
jgi:O-methyltransferase